MPDPIQQLTKIGQSLWYDNIERRLIENHELERMVQDGEIRGLTSNPSIFHQAIARSGDYDSALIPMAWAGFTAEQILEQLMLEDIRAAADILRPVYDETHGDDGYVSIEVNPHLAYDSRQTLKEARRLWKAVNRPNLMVKIPATKEGLSAIQEAVAAGLNINITLIFSLTRYLEVMEAYLSGLEARLEKGQPVDQIASVASFFVSRIDTKADKALEAIIREEGPEAELASKLLGGTAIANAKLAYREFKKVFGNQRFEKLKANGARVQRPLWASTSTKNPAFPDTLYVDELIGPDTVNTVPQSTLEAFKDHGNPRRSVDKHIGEAQKQFKDLEKLGISLEQITQELETEGVEAFAKAYDALLETIEKRREMAVRQLGPLAEAVKQTVQHLEDSKAVQRLFKADPTLWTEDLEGQKEIKQRLGWLNLPESSRQLLPELDSLGEELKQTRYTHALLLGMGGSSLAPEVKSLMFGPAIQRDQGGGLDLAILDSTEPSQVLDALRRSPVENTLYIVSSKSGTTSEVNALLAYFWDKAEGLLREKAAEHFIAITDPGTPLEKLGRERKFRRVFLADPMVGGRYSALTAFGLVPAAILGMDVRRLLDRAAWLANQCTPELPSGRNPGLVLGAILAVAAQNGQDKLTFASDPELSPLGSWIEQLIAESSGKNGKGIIPVDGETLDSPRLYDDDRLFVYFRRDGMYDQKVDALRKAGHPVLVFDIHRDYNLGAEFYRWEFATAIACSVLGVNAFDQPDVQDNKTRTRKMIAQYLKEGELKEAKPDWTYKGIRGYLSRAIERDFVEGVSNLHSLMTRFVTLGKAGDYYAINAYLPRNPAMEVLLARLQSALRGRTRLATTLGFGPRFLHSTGQLHKGGPNSGVFLEITAEPEDDAEIPGEDITFATLLLAQALGDFQALDNRGRRVLRLHLPDRQTIHQIIEALEIT
jgi:transaldolase/glucose-6-phosphate isomerase